MVFLFILSRVAIWASSVVLDVAVLHLFPCVCVHLCWRFTIRVWLCWGRRLVAHYIAFHAIELKVCVFHSGCLVSIRSRRFPSVVMNRMHIV